MHRLLIPFLSILFSLNANAQTKEETIAWLMQKIEKHGKDVEHVVSDKTTTSTIKKVDNSSVQMISCMPFPGYETRCTTYQVDINQITSVKKFEDENQQSLEVRTNGLTVTLIDSKGNKMENVNWFVFRLNWDSEADLFERFHTALLKLISYNKENLPKEAF